jgi:hypothetical protein
VSDLGSSTYDYPAVTSPGASADPAGPFAGLLVTGAGALVLQPLNGPDAGSTLTATVAVGEYIRFPVVRIDPSSTAAVVGLVSGIVRQGTATS